jgi:V8-like Glu-specific endopeptidase
VRRRPQLTLALAGAVLLLAAPGTGAAAVPDGAVTGTFATSPAAALAHWTPQRRAAAEPLEVPTLPRSAEGGAIGTGVSGFREPFATPSYVPAISPGEEAPQPRSGSLATTSTVEGVPVGAEESTVFPNSANGVVFGEYETHEKYRCSGSVVSSSAGDVVLTAGHCVRDPETGAVAGFLVFIPAYHEGVQPYGQWAATEYAITEQWAQTSGTSKPDEAGDVAMLKLASSSAGASVQSTVGALGIAFNQPRPQTYTQYGYPAEKPYNGKLLYSHTAPYLEDDPSFTPPTMKIATDFTGGSSGGPWTVSSGGTPVALSITDYGYKNQPGYLYGPYFGSLAQRVYEVITGTFAPVPPPSPAPASTPAPPAPPPVWLRLLGISRDRGSGTATVRVAVSGAGVLRLSGGRVWTATRQATAPATLSLKVRARGGAAGDLREAGSVAVGVRLSFTAAGGTATRSRLLRLTARPGSP